MASDSVTDETTVNDRYAVTIPSPVRSRLDIQAGDKVRWTVTSDGSLDVQVVKQRERAFAGFEPFEMGPTHAAEDHDVVLADEVEESR